MRVSKSASPIISRILSISQDLISLEEIKEAPKEPEEFLSWYFSLLEGCTRCPLSETRSSVVFPDGNTTAEVMIVGEGPGYLEDRSAIPFSGVTQLRASRCRMCMNIGPCYGHKMLASVNELGKVGEFVPCKPKMNKRKPGFTSDFFIRSAGAILDGIIASTWGLSMPRLSWVKAARLATGKDIPLVSPWFITNAVRCRSMNRITLTDSPPDRNSKSKCFKWLVWEWAVVNPKAIVALGRPALSVFVGETSSRRFSPGDFEDTKFGRVFFDFHPAYYMRAESKPAKAMGYAGIAKTLKDAVAHAYGTSYPFGEDV